MTLTQCTADELDHREQRAEDDLNRALRARRWNLVQLHRAHLQSVRDERRRRMRVSSQRHLR